MCKYGNVCPYYNGSAENCKKDEGYEDLDCISTIFTEYKKQKQAKAATYIRGPLKVCNSFCYNQPPYRYRGFTNGCPSV